MTKPDDPPVFCAAGVYLVNPDPGTGFHRPCESRGTHTFPRFRGQGSFWLCDQHAAVLLAILDQAYDRP